MKNTVIITLLFIYFQLYSQTKPIAFFNEDGKEISTKKFLKSKDYKKNIDIYFETDTLLYAILVKRENFGQLDKSSFQSLKKYLNQISNKKVDSTDNIVINYLTHHPGTKKIKSDSIHKSRWDIFHRNYIKKLNKISNTKQFWINSPNCINLEYYHSDKIDWITDKDKIIKKFFFPHELGDGYYILIKPNGKFYYYLGEHSKNKILKDAKKYFK